MAPDLGAVVAKAVEMALNGDRQMIKLILDLHISKPAHVEDEGGGKNQVNILVQNLTKTPSTDVVVKEIIDVQPETPRHDGDPKEHAEEHSVSTEASFDDSKQ